MKWRLGFFFAYELVLLVVAYHTSYAATLPISAPVAISHPGLFPHTPLGNFEIAYIFSLNFFNPLTYVVIILVAVVRRG